LNIEFWHAGCLSVPEPAVSEKIIRMQDYFMWGGENSNEKKIMIKVKGLTNPDDFLLTKPLRYL